MLEKSLPYKTYKVGVPARISNNLIHVNIVLPNGR